MDLRNDKNYVYLICGKARHGKTTVGKIIHDMYKINGINSANTFIALYLKSYAKQFFGWDGNDETKPRELLQELGTDIIRKKLNKPKFFIDRTIEDIEILSHFFGAIIIDDIRFEEEIEDIKAKYPNVVSIKINRTNFKSELSLEQQQHASEVALDNYNDYDYVVENDGSIDDLKEKIEKIVKKVDDRI